jgi:chromosomal replication initiation ATPase DnaA
MSPAVEIMSHQPAPGRQRLPAGFSDRIIAEVARRHGLTPKIILGRCRVQKAAHARQEAMALIYETGQVSLPWIGRKFNRDHTTVLHGVRAHAARGGAA